MIGQHRAKREQPGPPFTTPTPEENTVQVLTERHYRSSGAFLRAPRLGWDAKKTASILFIAATPFFSHRFYARACSVEGSCPRIAVRPLNMALLHAIPVPDLPPLTPRPLTRQNVIPFPARRVLLPVTLPVRTQAQASSLLHTLLHSPLGAYVVNVEAGDETIRVACRLARNDLGFALHTLLATLPEATLGRVLAADREGY
ncbi:hypothetical protein Bsp3421_003171 [Burkholderia sp. FERM BP-3421]|uniref:hypothetical protein n=1 Tax=Burkholderia sp. FERM BP-3421 TaxID=1494466 RepID=UPI00236234C8|nr:hypothetical protein [Burkholderia sp. FERM BP-3421]WDD93117.1 hypothetical protein Bsp3421_003171 [Burkholderia sp. FERM BP-3421]